MITEERATGIAEEAEISPFLVDMPDSSISGMPEAVIESVESGALGIIEEIRAVGTEVQSKFEQTEQMKQSAREYALLHIENPQEAQRYVDYLMDFSRRVIKDKHNYLFSNDSKVETFLAHFRETLASSPHLVGVLKLFEERDPNVLRHVIGTAAVASVIAERLGYDYSTRRGLTKAALMHDGGKFVDYINKWVNFPDKLPHDEAIHDIKEHPRASLYIAEAVSHYENPHDHEIIKNAASSHHITHNNKDGYPQDLEHIASGHIKELVGVITVSDAYDTIMAPDSERPYKKKQAQHFDSTEGKLGHAVYELNHYSGTQFNPKVTDALTSLHEEKYHKHLPEHVPAASEDKVA